MKPPYWKFLLILGAMIVGASLVVPKALRKNAAQNVDNMSQTLLLTQLHKNASLETVSTQSEDAIVTIGKIKYFPTIYNTNLTKLTFAVSNRFLAEIITPTYSLNAGTRPTKSRVVD